MTYTENTATTLNVTFNTFASPTATVTLYKQQADGTYQPHTNDRTTITNFFITISNLLSLDEGLYLITAANTFGSSINNLTFDLTVNGKNFSSSMIIVF